MSYIDSGFNRFLEKPVRQETGFRELDAMDTEQLIGDISGGKIIGGLLRSQDGKTSVNLDTGAFVVNDGRVERVRLGKQEDGTIGIVVRDDDDNVLIQITGETNFIQSPTGNLLIDFDEERVLVKDETGTPRILLGKQAGGF